MTTTTATPVFEVNGVAFTVEGEATVTAWLADLYGHCPIVDRPPDHVFSLRRHDGAVRLARDDTPLRDLPAAHTMARLVWEINQLAQSSASAGARVLVHAGVCTIGGVGVMVCGPAESGKSTLVAALCARGAVYLSDEVASVDLDGRSVRAFPKPITLERGSWAALATLEPRLPDGVRDLLADCWYVRPPTAQPAAEVGLVVVPAYRPGATVRVEAMGRAEAVMALATQTFNLRELGGAALRALTALARSARAIHLELDDLADACHVVAEAAADR